MYTKTKMQIAKCKMKNEKWAARPVRHFTFCNEHFAFCIFPPRSGLSLTEVLIAMGILTLGLLGVAALFPVGGFYMQKAEISDRGSAIAQAVMSDIVSRGMLNPRSWYVLVPPAAGPNNPTSPNYRFVPVDGMRPTFSRPFAAALALSLGNGNNPAIVTRQFGNAYVIDPMTVAAAVNPLLPNNNNTIAYPFPSSAWVVPISSYYSNAWAPWQPSNPADLTWPVRRVTFRQSSNGLQLDSRMAEHYFRGNDDLATELPPRDDRPARQNWDIASDGTTQMPLSRQWTGDYSWIVTVAPSTNAARDALATNPEAHAYDVSVVVFYKRVLPDAPPVTATDALNIASYERAVRGSVMSTGLNGGELLLTDLKDNPSKKPFDELKTGQWIMLCGPHPNSTTTEPRFALNWYQVLSIDKEGTGIASFNPTTARIVAVRGPEWPWQPRLSYPSSQQNSDVAKLSDNLCVAICRGAVAVHTKTFRLESRAGAQAPLFGSGGPEVNQQPNYLR